MSTKHEEFPQLTQEARAAHDAGIVAIQSTAATISPNDLRRLLAAFLQEAMRQALDNHMEWHGCWIKLKAIADNLYCPPPPPPSLAQAREAARQLGGEDAAIVHAFLASLGEGGQP